MRATWKCEVHKTQVQELVWKPWLFSCIQRLISNKSTFLEQRVSRSKTLILSKLPKEPWTQLGIDLFKFKGKWYVVIEDFFPRFLELLRVDGLTSKVVIDKKQRFRKTKDTSQSLNRRRNSVHVSRIKAICFRFFLHRYNPKLHYPKSKRET